MSSAHPTILGLDRLIGPFLRAPATAAAARIVLCLPFWWSGLSKLLDFSGGTAEMAAPRPRTGVAVKRTYDLRPNSANRYW
jgi:hypothetical protein